MTIDDTTREKALKLLRRGMITQAEAAELTGMSRQLVHHWVKRDGIDIEKARRAYLKRLWSGRA
jgi:predicted HTH domain antitoxin